MSLFGSKKTKNIIIPVPKVEIRNIKTAGVNGTILNNIPEIYLFWDGSNNDFLSMNPRFWLERYKPKQKKMESDSSGNYYRVRGLKWVHPTHRDGSNYAGSKFYSGQHSLLSGFRNINTEWGITNNPYDKTQIDLDPRNWVYFSGSFTNINQVSIVGTPQQWETHWGETGQSYSNKRCRMRFRFRIAVDNPDYDKNDPVKRNNDPVLKGDASQEIFFVPIRGNGSLLNWRGGFGQQY